MAEKMFKSGEVIFKEGSYEGCMYELLEGTVGIFTHYGEADEKCLTELKAGNNTCFGEMGLLEAKPRSATAVAMEDVRVTVVTGEEFGTFFEAHPERVYAVMTQMGSRIRELSKDYLDACRASAELVETKGQKKEKSGWFKVQLNKILAAICKDIPDDIPYQSPWVR